MCAIVTRAFQQGCVSEGLASVQAMYLDCDGELGNRAI